ncbi:MAG: hypothetical protein EPN99_09320, partial [Frankiales bacterium]
MRSKLVLALIAAAAVAVPAAPGLSQTVVTPPATPQGECGPGSIPEPGMQGRVPADDVEAGGAAQGYRCNVEVVGRHGASGGFKVERYVDASGNECAYYDTTL